MVGFRFVIAVTFVTARAVARFCVISGVVMVRVSDFFDVVAVTAGPLAVAVAVFMISVPISISITVSLVVAA